MTIKHVSFDAWNTLLIPNRGFAEARDKLLAMYLDVSIEEIRLKYKATKDMLDSMAIEFGFSLKTHEVWHRFLRQFKHYDHDEAKQIMERVETLFRRHPPLIWPDTVDSVKALQKKHHTSITSNTNFIRGQLLREVFLKNGFGFDFCLFSDELAWAKPDPSIFKKLHDSAQNWGGHTKANEIVHIGDHAICDVEGALKAGMQARQVHSIDQVPDIITKIMVER